MLLQETGTARDIELVEALAEKGLPHNELESVGPLWASEDVRPIAALAADAVESLGAD